MNFDFTPSTATQAATGSAESAQKSYHSSPKCHLATDSLNNQLLDKSLVGDGKTLPFHDEYQKHLVSFGANSIKPRPVARKEEVNAIGSVAEFPPSPQNDDALATLNEFSDWYKQILPSLDTNHDGRLSFEELCLHPSLRGKDEAYAAILFTHFEDFAATGKLSLERMKNSSKLVKPETAEEIAQELAVAENFVKVVDWTRDHRNQFHTDADGLISKSEIDNAIKNPSRFHDAESQRMLHFLQKDFDCMAATAAINKPFMTLGIPSRGGLQETMLFNSLNAGEAETQYDSGIVMQTATTGAIGGAASGGIVGAAVGFVAGIALAEVGRFALYLAKNPYNAFVKDLQAATQSA